MKHSVASLALVSASLARLTAAAELYKEKYGQSKDLWFSGITTFAHLPATVCLNEPNETFDIAILGAPYDSSVSYRTGARFGPKGIRDGSRRQRPERGYSALTGINPYKEWAKIIDCGDVPMNPYDPAMALDQLQTAYKTLLSRPPTSLTNPHSSSLLSLAKDASLHPRIVTLGGDHTIVLPNLRALAEVYGPISVVHFDSHLDTWDPDQYKISDADTKQSGITHGTFFAVAAKEGLIAPSIHLGIRTRLTDLGDFEYDEKKANFKIISSDDIDDLGPKGIAEAVHDRIGSRPCYISLDIDVADPAFAPGTGTMETGGWTPREIRKIIRGLHGLNIVGVDVVEVSPPYDSVAEITSYLASDIVHEFLSIMVKPPAKAAPSTGHTEL